VKATDDADIWTRSTTDLRLTQDYKDEGMQECRERKWET